MLCVAVGVQFSVLANVVAKLLVNVPLLQLMQARFLLQCLVSGGVCITLRMRGHSVHLCGHPGQQGLLALRSCLSLCGLGCFWHALRILPIGEATATMYLSPVISGFLATCLLGERLSFMFLLQATISIVGSLFILDPFDASGSPPAARGQYSIAFMVTIVGCTSFAAGDCTVRMLQNVHPMELQLYQDTATALLLLPALRGAADASMAWSTWSSSLPLVYLATFTLCGLAASVLVIVGYSLAPVSKAAPFAYLEVPSAFALQIFLFDTRPELLRLLGAALVVFAAVGRFWYEVRSGTSEEVPPKLMLPLLSNSEPSNPVTPSTCASQPTCGSAAEAEAPTSSIGHIVESNDRHVQSVRGSVAYAVFSDGKPRFWPQVTETGMPARYQCMSLENHEVEPLNGHRLSLNFVSHGLELVAYAPTRLTASTFCDDAKVERDYYQEAAALLKTVTRCDRVVVFNHARRSSTNAVDGGNGGTRDPSAFVHGDYSPDSALERLSQVLPEENQALRVCIVNVWRSMAGTVEQKPLALILNSSEAEALSLGEIRDVQTIFPGCMKCASFTRFMSYSPQHRWVVFPQMAAEEALVFKVFDSEDGTGIFHTALDDSAFLGEGVRARESIEVRAFCLWYRP